VYGFWDDLNLSTSGTVHYLDDAANGRFIIQYTNVPHFSTGELYTFQVILNQNGNIVYQYLDMQSLLNSSTIGIENESGTVGLSVAYNTNYVHNNLAVQFALPNATWISENPIFGIIPPGGSQNVTVTFDATGLTVGTTYNAGIFIDPDHADVAGTILVPASLKVQPADSALIILSKSSLVFPTTALFATRHDSLTARNGGALPLTITSITHTNSDYVVTPASATVAPGDSVIIRVHYTPTLAGTDLDTIVMLSNSQGSHRMEVPITGTAIGVPAIAVRPDSFTVTVPAGSDTTRHTLTIRNSGTDVLNYTITEGLATLSPSMVRSRQQQTPLEQLKGAADGPTNPSQLLGRGGPDAFGYAWIDSDEPGGPAFNWEDITSTGTQITTWTSGTPDDGSVILPLTFNFSFYGSDYSQLKVCTNGWVGFDIVSTSNAYSNSAIPSAATQPNNAIYPFWDDLNLNDGGTVHYLDDVANNRFIVQYTNVPHYTSGELYTFQVILGANGTIMLQYLDMQSLLNSATIGIEDAPGAVALQVVYNANYVHNNLAVLITKDLVPWLSTDVESGTIAVGDSQQVEVRIHPAGLGIGSYDAVYTIAGNTPDIVTVPVHMEIITTGVADNLQGIPVDFVLKQNYPNPFNPSTVIEYGLPQQASVSLRIYNMLGQEVCTLLNTVESAGYHKVEWNGRTASGSQISSGVYFYRFLANDRAGNSFSTIKKMLLMK
jgi:hypothetical protein